MNDDEAITVYAYQPHEEPPPDQRRAMADALRRHFAEMDERTKDVSDDEAEEILDVAIRSVRPGYRAVR